MEIKFYVQFLDEKSISRCSCFEHEEEEAKYFASLVKGLLSKTINGRTVYKKQY